ncbi:MAG: OmpA family protein, partial [Bacteroidota bacterium]
IETGAPAPVIAMAEEAKVEEISGLEAKVETKEEEITELQEQLKSATAPEEITGIESQIEAKREKLTFMKEGIKAIETKLFLVNKEGKKLELGERNVDGYYSFGNIVYNKDYIFSIDAKNAELIDEVQVLCKNKDREEVVIKVPKDKDGFFRYEYLPHNLYIVNEEGNKIKTGVRNEFGCYSFGELSYNTNYIFFLDAKNAALIDEIRVLCINKEGEDVVITVPKDKDGFFRYEYLPSEVALKETNIERHDLDIETEEAKAEEINGMEAKVESKEEEITELQEQLKSATAPEEITGIESQIETKREELTFMKEEIKAIETVAPSPVIAMTEDAKVEEISELEAKVETKEEEITELQEQLKSATVPEEITSIESQIETKKDELSFMKEEIKAIETKLFLVNKEGSKIKLGERNIDGYYSFGELSYNKNYIFSLNAENAELTNEVQVLCTNKEGKEVVITVPKDKDGFFRYEYLPSEVVLKETDNEISGSDIEIIADEKKEEIDTASTDYLFANMEAETEKLAAGKNYVIENILYDFDKSTIKQESYPILNKLAEILNDLPGLKAEISGHTDHIGPESYNQILSERRALAVVNYLIKQGINKTRLIYKGFGEARPIAPNVSPDGTDNPKGRIKNRRTEIKII